MTRRFLPGLAGLAVLALSACGSAGDETSEHGGDLTVFAAASLHVVFEDVADLFEAEFPGTSVVFSFAGSADLVAQLDAGAPADVLATANEETMERAVESGTIALPPTLFARNHLTLVTPRGNPGEVTGLDASLADASLVLCAPQVPCGSAALALAERLGITLDPVSEEGSVTDVLGKITSGQADAGLVYTSDAAVADDAVEVIAVDGAEDVLTDYFVAATADTDHPDLAAAWRDVLLGAEAQQVLRDAGFEAP